MYIVIPVPEDAWASEQLGTKFKFWFMDEKKHPVLFKQGRDRTGENWAEKVSCELAKLLGLPHAHYDFAQWRNIDGVITSSFVPIGARLVHGNEILRPNNNQRYGGRHHIIRRVMTIMRSSTIKPCNLEVTLPANDVFLGYLMLDSLIGNSDRHDENWGLISSSNGIELAPTFDHASSLGRNESDEKRQERLITKDKGNSVEAYATRTRSALYNSPEDAKPLTTFDAFKVAAEYAVTGKSYWLSKLAKLSDENVNEILYKIPDHIITSQARDFAFEMLSINKHRLLNEVGT